MALFPAFIELKQQAVLLVGAGAVAWHKLQKLMLFEPKITVIAPQVCPEILDLSKQGKIKLQQRMYRSDDLQGQLMVIVAVDDLNLQKQIFLQAKAQSVWCNAVDSKDYCQFIFPALVLRQDLSLGISTAGKAPALSAALRRYLDAALPEDMDALVEAISQYRASMPKGPERMQKVIDYSNALFQQAMQGREEACEEKSEAQIPFRTV